MKIRTCALATVVVAALLSAAGQRQASADPATVKKIETINAQAMENYDLLDYEEAKKLLFRALAIAKRNRLDDAKISATVYINLAIIELSGFADAAAAELYLIDAVAIDANVSIPAAYKTSELQTLLDKVKGDVVGVAPAGPEPGTPRDTVNCGTVDGLEHKLVEEASAGADKDVEALVAASVGARTVSLYYRPDGAVEFTRVVMRKEGGCKYIGTIPGSDIRGEVVHYFVAAENAADKPLASRGSKGSPNIIEVLSASGGVIDGEDPLGGDIGTSVEVGDAPSFFFTLAGGTGAGFVTGRTEQANNDVKTGFAPALLTFTPEIGTFLNENTSLSAAFRIGITVGANLEGKSPGAPAGFIRLRHGFGPGGTGLTLNGSLGFGVIRHVVELTEDFDENPDNTDRDTQASGPLFLGGGIGYVADLGGVLRPYAELNALAGLPVVDSLGATENISFALTFDLTLGLMFAF